MSIFMLFEPDVVSALPEAEELWQDVKILRTEVDDAELAHSRLALEVEWRKTQEQEALALYNELWREEQLARQTAKDNGPCTEEEASFLASWAEGARALRHSDCVNWAYLCAAHRSGQAQDSLAQDHKRLTALRRCLARAVKDAVAAD